MGRPPAPDSRDKAKALYDERFCRMWEFYLASAEVTFRHLDHVVLQIQLAKRQDAVPLTRDYITELERALAQSALKGVQSTWGYPPERLPFHSFPL